MRVHGDLISEGLAVDVVPVCGIGVYDLGEEWQGNKLNAEQKLGDMANRAKEVMQKDRDCKKFTPRVWGLTPKEHIDMLATQEMLNAQAARAEAQAERERQWRKEDMILAAANLKAAQGNTVGVWVGIVAAFLVSIASFVWTIYHTPSNPTLPTQTTPQTSKDDPTPRPSLQR